MLAWRQDLVIDSQQKREPAAIPADHRVKLKESKKER